MASIRRAVAKAFRAAAPQQGTGASRRLAGSFPQFAVIKTQQFGVFARPALIKIKQFRSLARLTVVKTQHSAPHASPLPPCKPRTNPPENSTVPRKPPFLKATAPLDLQNAGDRATCAQFLQNAGDLNVRRCYAHLSISPLIFALSP